ncbi:MAG: rhomboid family intramembrane serine protease [Bacteroidales bacterium]|jgi:membrane associated rhomboid family serine protease|nr:rhomboid family intramembrane serine protease [Bacteroidales bacterium]
MAGIFDNLSRSFKRADILMQFISINIGVFVASLVIMLVCKLFNVSSAYLLDYIELPSELHLFVRQPWTLVTYMFIHYDFMHILFNMLWLYWFGRIFLFLFSGRQLGGLYILGGIGGAVAYLLAFNIFPYFEQFSNRYLLGASASVLAIVVAPAVAAPNFSLRLLFLGKVKLKYIALFSVLIDIYYLSQTTDNPGGHIAHLGGALTGFLFARQLSKGKDITAFINKCIDSCWNFFQNKPKMKVTSNRTASQSSTHKENAERMTSQPQSPTTYQQKINNEEIDLILDKLKKSGYDSLSSEEKKSLFNASKSK